MNTSTENVTLFAAFLNDVLNNYQDRKEEYQELFAIVEGYDLSNPMAKVPMQVYNDLCQWIEDNLGEFSLTRIGRAVGETAFEALEQNGITQPGDPPAKILQGLKTAAETMIQDPEGRGWEILSTEKGRAVMRRTQTFNSRLQIGLLDGLVRKSQVPNVQVRYLEKVEDGAEYDDYQITWFEA